MLKLACSVVCGKQCQFPTIALGRYQDKVVCPFTTRVRRLPLLWHQLCANLPFRFWVEIGTLEQRNNQTNDTRSISFVQKCFQNVLKGNKLRQSDPFPRGHHMLQLSHQISVWIGQNMAIKILPSLVIYFLLVIFYVFIFYRILPEYIRCSDRLS